MVRRQEANSVDDSPPQPVASSPASRILTPTNIDQASHSSQAISEPDVAASGLEEASCQDASALTNPPADELNQRHTSSISERANIELRLLVRRREAGALIGKRGSNIKRLRDNFRSSVFSVPDTGNGPERVVCIATDQNSLDDILHDLTQMLLEKSPENDNQIELKLLIHSSHAGSIIGIGGQSIKKLRNDSKAAIKIYEMCCPLSNERVCAIKAKPPVVVTTIKLVQEILSNNPTKGTIKPYDALNFDLHLVDKYGGYLADEHLDVITCAGPYDPYGYTTKAHMPVWRPSSHIHQDLICDNPISSSALHTGSFGRQSKLSQADQSELRPKYQNTGNQHTDEGASSSSEFSAETKPGARQATHHHPRVPRFHPYFRQPAALAPVAQRSPILPSSMRCHTLHGNIDGRFDQQQSFSAQYRNSPAHIRFQGLMSANQQNRCQHSRPCLCMLLPVMAADTGLSSTPFIHLMNTLQASRNSTHMYKKK